MSDEEEYKSDEEESKYDGDNKGIDVFLRIRPSKNGTSGFFTIDDFNQSALNFRVPKAQGLIVNNTRTNYSFKFTDILDEQSNQDEVFRKVGAPAIRNAINGFNSTIFAYGQTGSGKTFTITGGPERYADRGIIPRAISSIFKEFQNKPDINFSCFISYLEIYNENGYDLLSEEHSETSTLEDMQRVNMLEDEDGTYHFRNLSVHPIASEEDALNKLFLGDTNRAIGETEMNQASSRSHCIFTISIEGRRTGSDSVVRSKLNLVDLAGSERVHKTSSSGQTLTEAKHINSSLFFLEMVIVSLHEKSTKDKRVHVPYRNSMMTSVLRDSLGGNCMTAMIATISPEENQTDESISTCHFAQRVALVKNSAYINEELEPELIIRRLKIELGKLREEIKFLKGETGEDETMSQDQRNELIQQVHSYVDSKDIYATLNIGRITLTKIHDVHAIFKNIFLEARNALPIETNGLNSTSVNNEKELQLLHHNLAQKDREIAILVNIVKKGKGVTNALSVLKEMPSERGHSKDNRATKINAQDIGKSIERRVCGVERCTDSKILDDPQLAYNWFQKCYQGCKGTEENKSVLKSKYDEAKKTGSRITDAKANIARIKETIERDRRTRALDAIRNPGKVNDDESQSIHPDEIPLREAIERDKETYKTNFSQLRELKATIEHLHKLMEKNKIKMQNEFDVWYREMCGDKQKNIQAYCTMQEKQEPDTKQQPRIPPGIKLTGNKRTDADILAFYKAKEALLARTEHK